MASTLPSLAVVVPVFNGARFLPALFAALSRCESDISVTVVDAGSTDDSGSVAKSLGAKVITLPHRVGPARARNVGVAHTSAEVILFVDADCVPHDNVLAIVRRAFAEQPELVSLTGSYDSKPPEQNFFSQYMNLRHRYHHQRARRSGASFWAGCGAVRRKAFLDVGGFDENRYPWPQIEDIELGTRLAALGPCQLDPALQVTHLKRWSLWSVVETDIWSRAVPWSRLILDLRTIPNDLNLAWKQRVAAGVAPMALLGVAVLPWAVASEQPSLAVASAAVVFVAGILAADMFRFFAGLKGPMFAFFACLFQQVHLVYSTGTLMVCAATAAPRRRTASTRSHQRRASVST